MAYQSDGARLLRAAFRNSLERRGFNVSRYPRVSCDQCEVVCINGIACHETRCPNARHECNGCNNLVPINVRYCEDCQ